MVGTRLWFEDWSNVDTSPPPGHGGTHPGKGKDGNKGGGNWTGGGGWGKGGKGNGTSIVSNLTFVNTVAGGRTTVGTSTGVNYTGAGHAAGDLAVGAAWFSSNVNPNNYAALGYTELGQETHVSTRRLSIFTKELTGSEGNENFTHSSAVTMIQIFIVRGWDNTQALADDFAIAKEVGSTSTPDPAASVAPTFAGAKWWLLFLGSAIGTPTGVPTNYTTDELTNNNNGGSLGINSLYREDIDGDTATEDPSSWTLPVAETYNFMSVLAIKSS